MEVLMMIVVVVALEQRAVQCSAADSSIIRGLKLPRAVHKVLQTEAGRCRKL